MGAGSDGSYWMLLRRSLSQNDPTGMPAQLRPGSAARLPKSCGRQAAANQEVLGQRSAGADSYNKCGQEGSGLEEQIPAGGPASLS